MWWGTSRHYLLSGKSPRHPSLASHLGWHRLSSWHQRFLLYHHARSPWTMPRSTVLPWLSLLSICPRWPWTRSPFRYSAWVELLAGSGERRTRLKVSCASRWKVLAATTRPVG